MRRAVIVKGRKNTNFAGRNEKKELVQGSLSMSVKRGSFSDNTAKMVVFAETWNTLFRVLSSILCSSIDTQ